MRFILYFLLSLAPFQGGLLAEAPANKEVVATAKPKLIDLKKVFRSAPIIYSLLAGMSVASMAVWLYTLATCRQKEVMPASFQEELRALLQRGQCEEAYRLCSGHKNLLARLVRTGLASRKMGPQVMIDAMKSEGKRASTGLWQRLSFLNDVFIIAPMLGLLGTVIGMFYAFYDVNRSIESINAFFDGLGVAVGTTVVGLIVAILSTFFYTTLKYRLVRNLSRVEGEALALSAYIEAK